MKVLLINGGPHEHGCTDTALQEIAGILKQEGVETEIFWLGNQPFHSCLACGSCRKNKRCVFDDATNQILDKAEHCDGLIIGSPVHYASASGAITAIMDRVFYAGGGLWKYKPGAAVVSCRRAGSTATLEQLSKYFTINQMPIVSSQYWNMVHGNTPEEVKQDAEGMQIMRTLGYNMAWLLKAIEAGKAVGIIPQEHENRFHTNFIR